MELKNIAEQSVVTARQIIREMHDGKRASGLDWGEALRSNKVTVSEMIGTDDGAREFIEKVTYDVYQGRERVALLYPALYRTVSDSNLPQTLTEKEFGPVQVVFLEHFEGGEVKFGALGAGTEKVVHMVTYAAGIEYDEDMVEYNQYWRLSDVSAAFGEAYNKLLNHLHLSPIISGSYVATGATLEDQKAAQVAGTAQLIEWDTDLPTTLRNMLTVLPAGAKMLINSSDQFMLEDAIASSMYADTTPSIVKKRLSSADFIVYDGDSVTVGGKIYTYTGVTSGEMYFVTPKTNFVEYIKHDLRVDSDDGDLSRLVLSQIVGRARRGVLAGLGGKNGAVKVELES